jgi:hypothetical protein
MQPRSDRPPPDTRRAEQAARIRAMLKRWAAEDVTDEPEWDVTHVERLSFATQIESSDDARGS